MIRRAQRPPEKRLISKPCVQNVPTTLIVFESLISLKTPLPWNTHLVSRCNAPPRPDKCSPNAGTSRMPLNIKRKSKSMLAVGNATTQTRNGTLISPVNLNSCSSSCLRARCSQSLAWRRSASYREGMAGEKTYHEVRFGLL